MLKLNSRHRPGIGRDRRANVHLVQRPQAFALAALLFGQQRQQPRAIDGPDLVCNKLERGKDAVQPISLQHETERLGARHERVPARMLAEDDALRDKADILGFHDLVRLPVLEHAMLVDTGFVREGIGPHDRLVARGRAVGHLRKDAARRHDLGGVDIGRDPERVGASFQRHHDILERAIAGALANAVDGAFDLPRTATYRSQRIGYRHAEIVVTMGRKDRVRRAVYVRAKEAEQLVDLVRRRIAHGVGNVERGGAFRRGDRQAFDQKVLFGSDPVLGRKFDILSEVPGMRDRAANRLDHLGLAHLQLGLAMDRAGCQEDVDALARRLLQRGGGGLDILAVRARQRADGRAFDPLRNARDRPRIARRSGGEAGLDHIDPQIGERSCHAQLGILGHREARRLLAVAQSRVEDADLIEGHWLAPID